MLFPISTLENVVPAILHIYLGITLNIFNLLEDVCQKIDIDEEVRESEIEKNALFKKELEKIVENLQLLEHEMVIVSSDIIDTKNSLDRYKAVISVDTEKLNELVKVSTQNKARQRLSRKT